MIKVSISWYCLHFILYTEKKTLVFLKGRLLKSVNLTCGFQMYSIVEMNVRTNPIIPCVWILMNYSCQNIVMVVVVELTGKHGNQTFLTE